MDEGCMQAPAWCRDREVNRGNCCLGDCLLLDETGPANLGLGV
jgi:hypothetical protein